MNSDAAFRPLRGATNHAFSVTTTASTGVQLSGAPGVTMMALRILNTGSYPLYFAHAASATNAVIPTVGVPANGIRIAVGAIETMTIPANSYLSFIASGGTTNIEINIGEGV